MLSRTPSRRPAIPSPTSIGSFRIRPTSGSSTGRRTSWASHRPRSSRRSIGTAIRLPHLFRSLWRTRLPTVESSAVIFCFWRRWAADLLGRRRCCVGEKSAEGALTVRREVNILDNSVRYDDRWDSVTESGAGDDEEDDHARGFVRGGVPESRSVAY